MISPRFRRPVFLDLTKIRMPIGALTSIGHRISGVVLTIGVPVVVYLMAVSLEGEESFAHVSSQLRHAPVKAALVILVWAFSHHVLAGVRHLLSDFDIGSPLPSARRSAWLVNLGGVALAVLAGAVLL